jgi:hypothetical protein
VGIEILTKGRWTPSRLGALEHRREIIIFFLNVIVAHGVKEFTMPFHESECTDELQVVLFDNQTERGEAELPTPARSSQDLPPFPVRALPGFLHDFVLNLKKSIQVPVDLPAWLVLGVLSAASARKYRVQIGKTHGEPLGLCIACGLDSGTRKGPAYSAVVDPLSAFEREFPRIKAELKQLLINAEENEQRAQADEDNLRAKRQLDYLTPLGYILSMPDRYLTSDVTAEGLALLLQQNGARMAVMDPDGGGVSEILRGRYSRGSEGNIEVWLKGYSEEDLRIDRKTGFPIRITRPSLTAVLAVQPSVVRDLVSNTYLNDRGLNARFLYCLPKDEVGMRYYNDHEIDPKWSGLWQVLVHAALLLPDDGTPRLLNLQPKALSVWREFHDEVETRMAPGRDLAEYRPWAAKLAGKTARLAGILHIVKHLMDVVEQSEAGKEIHSGASVTSVQGLHAILTGLLYADPSYHQISPETMEAAVALGRYALVHAQRAFDLGTQTPAERLAPKIEHWFRSKGFGTFTTRDCYRNLRCSGSMLDITQALEHLEYGGQISSMEAQRQAKTGRMPSPVWEVVAQGRKRHK